MSKIFNFSLDQYDAVIIGNVCDPPLDPSAVLAVNTTTKGVVFSRMTEVQMYAIVNPVNGLIIYNTDRSMYYLFNGLIWTPFKTINKTVEIDFSTPGVKTKKFIVVDADVKPSSSIIISQSGNAPTGKSADENEMDFIACRALAQAGSFLVYTDAIPGPVLGKFKLTYRIE